MSGTFGLMILSLGVIPLLAGIALMGGQTAVKISHEQSGMKGQCFVGFSWTYYLFGWLVPIFRGEIAIGFLHLLITVFTFGLFQPVMSFLYNRQYSRRQFTDGWELADTDNQNALSRGRLGLAGETNGYSDKTTQAMLFGLIPPVILFIPVTIMGVMMELGVNRGADDVVSQAESERSRAEDIVAQLELDVEAARKKAEELSRRPEKETWETPELTRFENTYMEIERPLVANIVNSRKVMQIKVAIMTHYDERVVANMEKHAPGIRSETLGVIRKVDEQALNQPGFKRNLAEQIKLAMNSVLEKHEDFGGVEEVLFTEFVVQ
ncbi:flagellar basal body-associated FliL family protein [Luminiphilus sp.]|nr:flagellar basal body-associated FliL family protein [bacterium]MDB2556616.1 flagellar basal body-associated FliL family protein [Luminiphilus sp.]